MRAGYTCTFPVVRSGKPGKCDQPARWTGKRFRCDGHEDRPPTRVVSGSMSRPSTRKREKKVARQAEARAKVAARRERLRAAREAAQAAKLDPRRNLHIEPGRQVVVNDITPYARQNCGGCKGKGIFGTKADAEGNTQSAEPCRCAHLRFMKAHPEIIVTETGAAFWPAESSPIPAATPEERSEPHGITKGTR